MERQQINILCATDDNYVPYCGIMLTSVFFNNRDADILVYVITQGLTPKNSNSLTKLASQYGQKIEFVTADVESINFPIWEGDHVSIGAYLRLFAADLLPNNISKVLYLDCDIIVNKSLQELWNTDISNIAAGVIIDSGHFIEDRNMMCGLENAEQYFNSGVMLINLDYWREHNLLSDFLEFIKSHKDVLRSHDQDVLNATLKGHTVYLPIIYNFQDFYLFPPYFDKYGDKLKHNILSMRNDDIAIFHLSMPVKPLSCWHYTYPFHALWRKYKIISNWKRIPYSNSQKEIISFRILKVCWILGIKKTRIKFIPIK